MKLREALAMVAGGALFGAGLAWSSMISPEVVLQFLRWEDFGLTLVMGGAMAVVLLAYRFVPRWLSRPLLGGRFGVHASVLNRDTLVGAAIFGIGWGLCGVCPGPAIAGLGAGNWALLIALAGMAAGAYVQGWRANACGDAGSTAGGTAGPAVTGSAALNAED